MKTRASLQLDWRPVAHRLLLLVIVAATVTLLLQCVAPAGASEAFASRLLDPESRLLTFLLIAAATLVSEDLTCIAAGILAAGGAITLHFAVAACAFGIYVGDLLLFLAGRLLGRQALHYFARDEQVETASRWLDKYGAPAILLSRFMPGTRLPLYLAAGALRTSFVTFAIYFLVAVLLWTPLLVGAPALTGHENAPMAAIIIAAAAWLTIAASAHRRRRLMLSAWRRLTRWEFWPSWLFYIPVAFHLIGLAIRHRSLLAFTAANPAIPAGGFIGESKKAILDLMPRDFVPRTLLLREEWSVQRRLAEIESFPLPLVLKPDLGQRGSGVVIARTVDDCRRYFESFSGATVAQEYVDGPELGIFYVRMPNETSGRIFAITEKVLIGVRGDGEGTLERLILDDDRAVCMAPRHLRYHAPRLNSIPARGELVPLVDLGTHCRGALFLDGGSLRTRELESAVDRVSRAVDGFYFGRYDVRGESLEALQEGRFKILELNGVTSEATSIYDPRHSLAAAYRVLFEQWRLAFEIGAMNARRGQKPATVADLVQAFASYRRIARNHPDPLAAL